MRNSIPALPAAVAVVAALFGSLIAPMELEAASLLGARVTRVIKDVKVVSPATTPHAARLNETIPDGGGVRTGRGSRAELAFRDRSVARLGANTVCDLETTSQSLTLAEGAVLFQAPAGGGPKIKIGGITASIGGTTGIVERFGRAYVKFLMLEGTARVYLAKVGESVLVQPGQLLITKPEVKTLPEAVHYDIGQLYKTSLLTNADFAPLASSAKITREIQKQQSDPDFIRTNLVIFGRGTLVNLVDPVPRKPNEKGAVSPTAPGSNSQTQPKR